MPALPSVPGVLEVKFVMGLVNDEDVVNRIHMKYNFGTPDAANLNGLANDTSGSWGTHIAPNMHSDLSLTKVVITDLSSPTSATGEWAGAIGGGATSGELLGAGSALRLNRTILRRYRGGRPGIFLPLTSSAYLVDPQTITGAYLAAIQTAWGDLEGDILGGMDARWGAAALSVSVSYYEGNTPFLMPSGRYRNIPKLRAVPVVDDVTGFIANPRVASQRRRNLTRS